MIPDALFLKKKQPFHDLDLSVQHLIFSLIGRHGKRFEYPLSWLDKVLTVKHGGLTAHELMPGQRNGVTSEKVALETNWD